MSLTRANMRAAECSTRALRWMVGIRIPAVDRGAPAAPNLAANCDNAAMGKKKPDKDKANGGGTVALNKRARHEYHLEERFEAGLALQGWELKSIRAGRANITESYAVVRGGELFLFGAQITPLISASSHVVADDRRPRKLLLHRREIEQLVGRVERDGSTLVPTALYWKGKQVKAELALAKGKQESGRAEGGGRAGCRERGCQYV